MASRPAGWDVDGETVVKGGLKRIYSFTRSHFSSHQRLSSESSSPLLIQILIQGAARRVGESAGNHMNQEWEGLEVWQTSYIQAWIAWEYKLKPRLDAFDLWAACCGDWKESRGENIKRKEVDLGTDWYAAHGYASHNGVSMNTTSLVYIKGVEQGGQFDSNINRWSLNMCSSD